MSYENPQDREYAINAAKDAMVHAWMQQGRFVTAKTIPDGRMWYCYFDGVDFCQVSAQAYELSEAVTIVHDRVMDILEAEAIRRLGVR